MQRLRRAAFPLALVAALGVAAVVAVEVLTVEESAADLDNLVFTSPANHVRMIIPRGWRASDQPSFPGIILWMARGQPAGQIELTAEPFNRELYCSWPLRCRKGSDSPATMYACALREALEKQRLKVGPTQAGPKDNEAAGLPSVWFEYDDGKRFLRQAIALSADRAFSLVLSTPTAEARATHTRAFEQALRTMAPLSAEEETARAGGVDAAVVASVDAGLADSNALIDAAALDAGVMFQSAPEQTISPIGSCPPPS